MRPFLSAVSAFAVGVVLLLSSGIFTTNIAHAGGDWPNSPDCPSNVNCSIFSALDNNHGSKKGAHFQFIVIHLTEGSWDEVNRRIKDPDYGSSFNYMVNPDGRIEQTLDPERHVGWHSANKFFNENAIGIEQIGVSGDPGSVGPLYQTTANLVRYLCAEYHIPKDRAHIIGHSEVSTTSSDLGQIANQHFDPGPFWDWAYFFGLIGSGLPSGTTNIQAGDGLEIVPNFQANRNRVTSNCRSFFEEDPECNNKVDLNSEPSNFAYVYSEPREGSPFACDAVYTASPGGGSRGHRQTTDSPSVGNHIVQGQRIFAEEVRDDGNGGNWIGFRWGQGEFLNQGGECNQLAWIHNKSSAPLAARVGGKAATPKGGVVTTFVNPIGSGGPQHYQVYPGQKVMLATTAQFSGYYMVWAAEHLSFVRASEVNLVDTGTSKSESAQNADAKNSGQAKTEPEPTAGPLELKRPSVAPTSPAAFSPEGELNLTAPLPKFHPADLLPAFGLFSVGLLLLLGMSVWIGRPCKITH